MFLRLGNGLALAKRLREFTLTKAVCELIDFDFEPHLINLGGADYPHLTKLVLQGKPLTLTDHDI